MRRVSLVIYLIASIFFPFPYVYSQPTPPILLEPCDGEKIETNAFFKWQNSPGALSYSLQILNTIDQTVIFTQNTVQNEYQLPNNILSISTPYYWQVKAVAGSQESDWSDIWGFRTLPNATDPFQLDEDTDKDGISDEMEHNIKTDPNKKTLFVRPKKKIGAGQNGFIPWVNFSALFPNSPPGRAYIEPLEDAGIEVVLIGDQNNPYEPMKEYDYDPSHDPNHPPCTIMEIVLERMFDDNSNPVSYTPYGNKGHTYIDHGEQNGTQINVWTWDRPAYTDSNAAINEYNYPRLYPYPIDRYFDEGAYEKIDLGQIPRVSRCSTNPAECSKASTMNLPDNAVSPPFSRSTDRTVEFNPIDIKYSGEITKIDINNRPIEQYKEIEVKAKLILHEIGHGLLSAVPEEHCENPCCIMYKNMIDWKQLLFGPNCGSEITPCSQVCEHSPGGSKDIRHYKVIYNWHSDSSTPDTLNPPTPRNLQIVN